MAKQKAAAADPNRATRRLFYLFFGFLAVIFPLVHSNATLDTAMMPRLLWLTAFLAAATAAGCWWLRRSQPSLAALRGPMLPLLGAWLAVTAAAMIPSVNPTEGLYDLVKAMCLPLLVFWGAALAWNTPDGTRRVAQLMLVSALLLSAVAVYEYVTKVAAARTPYFFEASRQTPVIYQVRGLMSHKNLLSIALAMLLPFSVYGIAAFRRGWRVAASAAAAASLALIVILQTRAVWVGLMAAAGAAVLILAILGQKFGIGRRARAALITLAAAGAVAVAGVVLVAGADSENPYAKRLASIAQPDSKDNRHRISIWATTLEMIPQKPLLGYGPGNWKLHAPAYFHDRFQREEELNWQRPHNDFLWVAAEKGIIGFLIYYGLISLAVAYLIAVVRRTTSADDRLLATLLLAALAAYLAASFFDFPYERVYHTVVLGIFLTMSLLLRAKLRRDEGKEKELDIKPAYILPALLLPVFGIVYSAQAYGQEVDLKIARAHNDYLRNNAQAGIQLRDADARARWEKIREQAAASRRPLRNLDPQANPVRAYEGLALMNLGRYQEAIEALLEAHSQHPTSIAVLNNLGAAYFKIGDYHNAAKYEQLSYDIFRSHDAITNLSAAYFKLGKLDQAHKVLLSCPAEQRTASMQNNLAAIERAMTQSPDAQ